MLWSRTDLCIFWLTCSMRTDGADSVCDSPNCCLLTTSLYVSWFIARLVTNIIVLRTPLSSTVDQILSWRGSCIFHLFMKKKHGKHSIPLIPHPNGTVGKFPLPKFCEKINLSQFLIAVILPITVHRAWERSIHK